MKKSFTISFFMHALLLLLLVYNHESKKDKTSDVYVVDLLNIPTSIEISNHVLPSIAGEYAEASIIEKKHGIFPTGRVSHKETLGKTGDTEETFSPDEYMAEVKRKLGLTGSSTRTGGETPADQSSTQPVIAQKKSSLASKIFPLTNNENSTGLAVGFQGSALPSGNIIPLDYIEKIKTTLQRKWLLPEGKNYSLTSVVSFRLKKDGTITDIYLETGSGLKNFDESALKAVKDTGKLDPLPATYKLDYLDITVKFSMRGIE